jgi:hypothetical protein
MPSNQFTYCRIGQKNSRRAVAEQLYSNMLLFLLLVYIYGMNIVHTSILQMTANTKKNMHHFTAKRHWHSCLILSPTSRVAACKLLKCLITMTLPTTIIHHYLACSPLKAC